MSKILSQKFFESRNTVKIAKSLLGKFLVRKYQGKTTAYMITEVEAYDGFKDKASHAHRGKTERNKIMFGPAGYWYVYFTYGVHWLLNIVTGPKDYPAAVLIRAVLASSLNRVASSSSRYRSNSQREFSLAFVGRSPHFARNPARSLLEPRYGGRAFSSKYLSINGPARLTKLLKIDGKMNGQPAIPHFWKTGARRKNKNSLPRVREKSGLWLEDWGLGGLKIKKGPRIGVDYAGPIWSKKPYRFYFLSAQLYTEANIQPATNPPTKCRTTIQTNPPHDQEK